MAVAWSVRHWRSESEVGLRGPAMHVRVLDRHELILSLVKGKRVLDLGAADNLHMDEKRQNDEWLHEEICRVASHCVGVDTDEECVERLRESGYDIRVGDVEELDLHEISDVVVAGELIEHVFNVGRFLDSARQHLAPEGILIVTTPNALALIDRSWIRPFRRTEPNPTHVASYSLRTLRQLVDLKGFVIQKEGYYAQKSSNLVKSLFRRLAYSVNPEWAEGLYVICKVRHTSQCPTER